MSRGYVITRQCLSKRRLGDLRSLCRIGGLWLCSCSTPYPKRTLACNTAAISHNCCHQWSLLTAIGTAGQQTCRTGPEAVVALGAAATKCASTTAWLPRHPKWQLSGTLIQTTRLLTVWWHTARWLLAGSVRSVAVNEMRHLATRVSKTKAGCRTCGKKARTKQLQAGRTPNLCRVQPPSAGRVGSRTQCT